MKERRVVTAVALTVGVALSLTACVGDDEPVAPPSVTPSIAPTAPSVDPESEPEVEAPPDFLPDGTALANKDYFDYVSRSLFAQQPGVPDIEILAMLESAGFDRSAMEVTRGKTPTGRNAEAIEFAVRAHDDCLIGQWGKNVYTSYIAPVLADGTCLLGNTLRLQ